MRSKLGKNRAALFGSDLRRDEARRPRRPRILRRAKPIEGAALESARKELLAARSKRAPPPIDRKIVTRGAAKAAVGRVGAPPSGPATRH